MKLKTGNVGTPEFFPRPDILEPVKGSATNLGACTRCYIEGLKCVLNGVQTIESLPRIIHEPDIAGPQDLVRDDAEQPPSVGVVVDECGVTGSYKLELPIHLGP